MTGPFEIVAIGNALVDVIAPVNENFLEQHGVGKGVMTLIDDARAVELYAAMPPARELSGGSGANTAAGLAALGVRTAYVGKVKDDQLGRIFTHDIRALGAHFPGAMVPADAPGETGRCLILVTPDGERSMNTALGVSVSLSAPDIDEATVGGAGWLYLEGYLFDTDAAKAAYDRAIRAVKGSGGRVSFTVSDPFCIHRHRDDMHRLIREDVDLLFANKAEVLALFGTDDFEAALQQLAGMVEAAAVTLSGEGALVLRGGERVHVPAERVRVVDTTGAGDLFASGFLAGLVRGRSDRDCARMGCIAAGEVISHYGARPEVGLTALLGRQGL